MGDTKKWIAEQQEEHFPQHERLTWEEAATRVSKTAVETELEGILDSEAAKLDYRMYTARFGPLRLTNIDQLNRRYQSRNMRDEQAQIFVLFTSITHGLIQGVITFRKDLKTRAGHYRSIMNSIGDKTVEARIPTGSQERVLIPERDWKSIDDRKYRPYQVTVAEALLLDLENEERSFSLHEFEDKIISIHPVSEMYKGRPAGAIIWYRNEKPGVTMAHKIILRASDKIWIKEE